MATPLSREFKVAEITESGEDEYLWCSLRSGGPKHGLQYALPRRHPSYSEELQKDLDTLEPGDRIQATVVSENERNTAWRFEAIRHRYR